MLEFILLSAISLIFFAMAFLLCVKGRITLIHSYHYKKVPVQLYKPYTFAMGIAMLIIGVAELAFALLDFIGLTTIATPVLVVGIVIGLGLFVVAQYKYNGGIF